MANAIEQRAKQLEPKVRQWYEENYPHSLKYTEDEVRTMLDAQAGERLDDNNLEFPCK